MIAALPMYDWPETAAAHDALWLAVRGALAARGIAAPNALDRGIGLEEAWLHPRLILGQTCGLPFRTRLHDRVALVGTLDYGLPGCAPGHYVSNFVVRRDTPLAGLADYAGLRFAYNQPDSHSGWAAAQITALARGFAFIPTLETGAHRASASAVAEGRADIAAIDAQTWRGIVRWQPELADQLRVIDQTEPSPGLALITARHMDAGAIFAAVQEALEKLAPEPREALGLTGIVRIPPEAYLAVPTPASPAHFARSNPPFRQETLR